MGSKSSSCGMSSVWTKKTSAVVSGIAPSLAIAAIVWCLSLSRPLLKRPCSSCVRFIIPQVPTLGFGASESLSHQNACVGSKWRAGAHPWAARMPGRMLVSGVSSLSLASRFLASAKLGHSQRTCLVVPLVSSQKRHVSVSRCPYLKALSGLQRLSDRQLRMSCAFGCCLPMLLSCW